MDEKRSVDISPVKVISDSFFYSVARITVLILKPVKGILLPRLLGPTLYGILNIPGIYVMVGSMLSNLGFSTSVLKLMPGYMQQGRPDLARMIYRSSAFLTLVLSSIWATLLLVLSPWISAHFAHEPLAVNPMRVYALAIPFLAVNAFYASVYIAVQRGKLGAAITFAYGLMNTFLPVAAVLWQRNVTLIAGATLTAEVVAAFIFTFCFHRQVLSGFGKAIGPLVRGMRETTSFGFLFFVAGLGMTLVTSIDRFMIKYYFPSDQLGYYAMGAQVETILNAVAYTIGLALVPALTGARDRRDERAFHNLIHNTSRFGFIVLMPVTMVSFELCRDFFNIFVPNFTPSIAIVEIVVAVTFIDLFWRIGWAALVAYGRGGLVVIANVIAVIVNVALNFALIPRYGIVGSAFAAVITFIVLSVTMLIMARRVTGCRIATGVWLHPFVLALAYILIGWPIRGWNPWIRVAVVTIGGTAAYGLLALRTGLVRGEDLAAIRRMLASRAGVPHVRLALGVVSLVERGWRIVGRRD